MASWREREPEEKPVVLPGQLVVDVNDEGETVIRETLIPPAEKKPRNHIDGQVGFGLAEGWL